MDRRLLQMGDEIFPVTVDYSESVGRYWKEMLKRITSWGNVGLEHVVACNTGIQRFVLSYAVLNREDHLWEHPRELEAEGIVPADIFQLLIFGITYLRTEVTAEKPSPIVAIGPGSTWRCSHDILLEAAGLVWDSFYHNPGPKLHTESAPFQKGTRILAVVE